MNDAALQRYSQRTERSPQARALGMPDGGQNEPQQREPQADVTSDQAGSATRSSGRPSTGAWGGIDRAIGQRTLIRCGGAMHDMGFEAALAEAATLFGALPEPWVEYVSRYGALANDSGRRWLLGLTTPGANYRVHADVIRTTKVLRALYRKLPTHLIPTEMLPDRQVACVDAHHSRARVVLIDLDNLDVGGVPWSPSLVDFIYEWRSDLYAINAVVRHLDTRRKLVADGKRAQDQLDRPGDWTVTRMCSEDVVLAVMRTRHNREHNREDISVFATATLSSFARGASVRAALTAILSDAYRSGGPLATEFGTRGNGPIPAPLRRWAKARGIDLPLRGGWDAETGGKLYTLAADLTQGTRDLLPLPNVPTGAVCFAVASGMWQPVALEALLRWSNNPTRLLTGALDVTDRLSWIVNRQVMRAALSVATLRRILARTGQRSASDDDDTQLPIDVTFGESISGTNNADTSLGAVSFSAPDARELSFDWPVLAGKPPEGSRLTMHILAVENDLLATQLPALARLVGAGRVVVVPADARTSTDSDLITAFAAAARAGVAVVASPDYTSTLDIAAENAVARARTART